MQKVKRILSIVFSLYALLVFIATFFLVFPLYFLIFNFYSKERGPYIAHEVSRLWAKILLLAFFIRVKITNKDSIDLSSAYVFISNHQSQLDILVSAISCKNVFRFLAKSELTKIPVIGYVIKRLYIPVNRQNRTERTKSMERMSKSLHQGISVWIYPEGTRNKTEDVLLDFYDGAFRLAIETQKPLAILTIINSGKLLSPLKILDLSPGKLYCIWDKPISTKGLTLENVQDLKALARERLLITLREFKA